MVDVNINTVTNYSMAFLDLVHDFILQTSSIMYRISMPEYFGDILYFYLFK